LKLFFSGLVFKFPFQPITSRFLVIYAGAADLLKQSDCRWFYAGDVLHAPDLET
jgi:hypothetical protein